MGIHSMLAAPSHSERKRLFLISKIIIKALPELFQPSYRLTLRGVRDS